MGVDFQIEINLGAIVELADCFGIALAPLVLGIDFVIDGGRQSREAVGAVRSNNISLDRASSGIGQVDDGIREGIVLTIKNLAEEEPANCLVFLVERSASERTGDHQKQTTDTCGGDH